MARLISPESEQRRVSQEDASIILEIYRGARATSGFSVEDWSNSIAEQLGYAPVQIRGVLSKENRAMQARQRIASATWAQQEAELIGATQAEALSTLRESLRANKHTLLVDKERRPILDTEGQFQYVQTPDNPTRVRAAGLLLAVHGSFAPKKVELKAEITHSTKTEEELVSELKTLIGELTQQGFALDVKPMMELTEGEKGSDRG